MFLITGIDFILLDKLFISKNYTRKIPVMFPIDYSTKSKSASVNVENCQGVSTA